MRDKVLKVFEEMESILKIGRAHRDNEKKNRKISTCSKKN